MKLLYITNGINGAGGLERVLSVKASYLAEVLGYEVHILGLNQGNDAPFYEFSPKITFHNIAVGGNAVRFIQTYIKGIKQTINQLQPDIISVCDDGLKGFFVPLILSKKHNILYERHASIRLNTSQGVKGKIIKMLMLFLANKFSKFVVLTKANKKEWNTANCVVIPNPLSFYPNQSSALNNQKVIVVGTHSFNKGYDLLLHAWKVVAEKYPNWRLTIYGKIDAKKTFINLANELNLNKTVNFFQPTPNIQKAYLEASMLLLSSRTEGFGMVLIEAMACGLPCVSFNCPSGPGDIIKTNEDGFLVEPENIMELAEKIIFLIENEQVRKDMGAKAKENVKRYLPINILNQWDALFKSLMK